MVPAAAFAADLAFVLSTMNGELTISPTVLSFRKIAIIHFKGGGLWAGARIGIGIKVRFRGNSVREGNPEEGVFTENAGHGPHSAISILRSKTGILCLLLTGRIRRVSILFFILSRVVQLFNLKCSSLTIKK